MGHTVIIMVSEFQTVWQTAARCRRKCILRGRCSEMAHRAIVGKICPDANFEGVDGAPGCTLRSLGDGKRTIVLEWYGHH